MTFVLEAVRTLRGSSLLLHFGTSNETPSRILIDCGAEGTYGSFLRPRLEQLRGDTKTPLPVHAVLACQIDVGHLDELTQLLTDIRDGDAPIRPETLWLNRSRDTAKVLSVANTIEIELNPAFGSSGIRADTRGLPLGHGLSIEVLSPHEDEVQSSEAALILLARKGDQSMLISGNTSGRRIARALIHAGYLDQNATKSAEDPFHVNLMPIAQNDQNPLTREFFKRITADSYLFTGDATEGNPDVETLRAIGEARGDDEFNVYFAMTASDTNDSPKKRAVLDWVASDMPGGCVAHFRDDVPDRFSTLVELPA